MVTYRRSPTVLELFALSVVLFAVASGMAIPTDSFQEASNSLGLEWSLVTGVYTVSLTFCIHACIFCMCLHVITFSIYIVYIHRD